MPDNHWSEDLKDICQVTYCPTYRFPYPECRDGWKGLLVDLITEINKLGVPWSVGQIKEKFGTLRFYADVFEPEESWIQEVSKPDRKMTAFDETVMKFINKTDQEKRILYNRFSELINEAEHKSAIICEECANPGKVRNLSWVQTLCENCYERVK